MKQVEVSILGQVYVLGCPDGGQSLLATAVSSVDKEMTSIRESGKVKARERIAVLAALNLAYQLAERPAVVAPPEPAAAGAETAGFDLEGLLQRVDAALADDGHLL
jgi:cell division protein ZapA